MSKVIRTEKRLDAKSYRIKYSALFIVLFLILVVNKTRERNDIEIHGVNNVAIIDSYKFVSFVENAKSRKKISFYRIGFNYQYNSRNYSTFLEIQTSDFKEKVGRRLEKGDEISIRHSRNNPEHVKLIKQ